MEKLKNHPDLDDEQRGNLQGFFNKQPLLANAVNGKDFSKLQVAEAQSGNKSPTMVAVKTKDSSAYLS